MAPVIEALTASERFETFLVNTGQHRELLWETMALFGLRPDVSLSLMQPGQRLAGFFGRCVEALDRALDDVRARFGPKVLGRAVLLHRDPGIVMPVLAD